MSNERTKQQQQSSSGDDGPRRYETYSWLEEPVDVNKECPMCILHKNGPCTPFANRFFAVLDKQMDVEDETSREYKQLLRKEDQAWDLLLACMKLEGNVQEYERRFAEMQAKGQLKLKNGGGGRGH